MEFLLLTYDIFHRDPTLIIQQEHQIVLQPLLIEPNSVGGSCWTMSWEAFRNSALLKDLEIDESKFLWRKCNRKQKVKGSVGR